MIFYCMIWRNDRWEVLHEHPDVDSAQLCSDLDSEGIVPEARMKELTST